MDEAPAPAPTSGEAGPGAGAARWALRGALRAFSVPAFVLFGSLLGVGGAMSDFGWPIEVAVLSTLVIWAAPGQLVLVGALAAGSVPAALFATSISAVRLLPMTVTLIPLLRGPRTPLWLQLFVSHYVAVTAWAEAMRLVPDLPRAARIPFFLGLANTLVALGMVSTGVGYILTDALPTPLALGLLIVTPIYFLLALDRGANAAGERLAIVLGFVLAPAFIELAPAFDLPLTGLVGGALAFGIEALTRRRRQT